MTKQKVITLTITMIDDEPAIESIVDALESNPKVETFTINRIKVIDHD